MLLLHPYKMAVKNISLPMMDKDQHEIPLKSCNINEVKVHGEIIMNKI